MPQYDACRRFDIITSSLACTKYEQSVIESYYTPSEDDIPSPDRKNTSGYEGDLGTHGTLVRAIVVAEKSN